MKKNLFYISLGIFFVLLIPLLIFAYWRAGHIWGYEHGERPDQLIVAIGWIAIFAAAAAFGSLGSAIKYFLGPSNSGISIYDKSIHAFISMHFFGAAFAIVVLLLFVGQLVKGGLFPEIDSSTLEPFKMRLDTWGKIMIWSFVAGYHEYFLPSLLEKIMPKQNETLPTGEEERKTLGSKREET
ncbi:MAG: hypothetical protein P9F75_16075 [Candidatus Contendobacter sp.]|nr:hypothetical protein [Candidatus Contendobacter sp.]